MPQFSLNVYRSPFTPISGLDISTDPLLLGPALEYQDRKLFQSREKLCIPLALPGKDLNETFGGRSVGY